MVESSEVKKEIKNVLDFFRQKKIINIIIIVAFLAILISSSWIRLQNLPLLKDSTSGEYIPLALDPFYFLRIAETIVNEGELPEYDNMRYLPLKASFSEEILPQKIVFLYRVMNVFGNFGIGLVDVLSPVIFFALGLIVFFFLIYYLTKSKFGALIGTAILAFTPAYLYRTMAGFADHESGGMFAFFLVILSLILLMNLLYQEDKSWKKIIPYSLILGFLTTFNIASWGGGATLLFLIIPLSFFIFSITNGKSDKKLKLTVLVSYFIWILFSVLFGLIFNYDPVNIVKKFMFSSNGLVGLGVLAFILVDYILQSGILKINSIKKEFVQIYSFIISIILGILFLLIIGRNPFSLVKDIWYTLLFPFGLGRVGLTVAENAQPYLLDWINQTGNLIFLGFVFGCVAIGIEVSRSLVSKRKKIAFIAVWILMISGILFSRISPTSIFEGSNFISQAFYIIGLLVFAWVVVKIYIKQEEININPSLIILGSWMFTVLISGRAASRMFFTITPFVCLSAAYFIIKIIEYSKKSKDDLGKLMLQIIVIISILLLVLTLYGNINGTYIQSKYTGPSANVHWQGAMSWVRNNTQEGDIFVHWWDYGYWVQYLGQRPTVTDGGHFNGYWDHLIGRYLLTTPYPETALSFMKAQNVSYLLIDPTDIGKYPAYSSIGSNDNNDRYSAIIAMNADPKQIQETSDGEIRAYQGTYGVEEDIYYNLNGTEIFLPGPTYNRMNRPEFKSFVLGIILEINKGNSSGLKQPEGVFVYNNQQVRIPLRYLYFNNELYDFETGLEAGMKIIPRVDQSSNGGVQIDNLGSSMYLSPRTFNSLLCQLYLMNDPLEKYEGVKLAHSEDSPIVKSLKSFNPEIEEFVYYNGIQGPIKIWKVDVSDNIIGREEFLRPDGSYAEFDDLVFVK